MGWIRIRLLRLGRELDASPSAKLKTAMQMAGAAALIVSSTDIPLRAFVSAFGGAGILIPSVFGLALAGDYVQALAESTVHIARATTMLSRANLDLAAARGRGPRFS